MKIKLNEKRVYFTGEVRTTKSASLPYLTSKCYRNDKYGVDVLQRLDTTVTMKTV